MKMNTSHDLREVIYSIRAKLLEEVTNLINSNCVNKDSNGFIMMYDEDLIKLIQEIDSARMKQKAEEKKCR